MHFLSTSRNTGKVILAFTISIGLMAAQAQRRSGGSPAQRPAPARPAAKPATRPQTTARPAATQRPNVAQAPSSGRNTGNTRNVADNRARDNKSKLANNKNISNNKVNIDKSRGDVNVNIDNSKNIRVNNNRNTVVRHNTYRPYTRPPYVYGGFHYRCYHPFYYHPYRPFYWGPVWHPWGFFIATLTATAIIVSFAEADLPQQPSWDTFFAMAGANNNNRLALSFSGPNPYFFDETTAPLAAVSADGEYYYDEGVFYLKEDKGYTVVAAPVGGIVKSIPSGFETIVLDDKTGVKNYYWGGTFYEKVSKGYKVVQPMSGAVVEHLAEGGEEVKLGEVTYVKLGETYYQPIQQNGKNMYEVVDVEAAK